MKYLDKLVIVVVVVMGISMISFGEAYQHCSSFCKTQPDKYICSSALATEDADGGQGQITSQLFGESGLSFRNGCEMACFNRAQITRGLPVVKKIKDGPCITILGDGDDLDENTNFNNLDN